MPPVSWSSTTSRATSACCRSTWSPAATRCWPAADGPQALALAAAEALDLVLLDVRMPGMDGFEVCRRLREFSAVPILFLTARADEEDKVRGLDAGADDYVTKPCGVPELLARVRAALRRAEAAAPRPAGAVLRAGGLKVDQAAQRAWVEGKEVELSPREYRLLRELVAYAGQVLTPAHLLEKAWGHAYAGEEALVRKAVHRLRARIEPDPAHPRYLLTRPGVGYLVAKD